ncbi:MAG: response regulator [Hyphomicrobiaceae bacterium]|nr:response regulator [Hyphomicrobiaceae bacterium]
MTFKVLIADDDPLARSLIATLVLRAGAQVTEVADGESAWIELRKGDYSAAILDLEMPGFDGFEIIGCMRGHPVTQHLPVIVITSRNDQRSIDRAQNAGATTYITKPVHWSAFGAHITHLLKLSGRKQSNNPPSDANFVSSNLEQLARRLDDMAKQPHCDPDTANAVLRQAAALVRTKSSELKRPHARVTDGVV